MNRTFAAALAAVFLTLAASGCKSPGRHRADADRVAGEIITEKQQEALGETEPFTIERPGSTLRKRLIEMQALPVLGPESLGTAGLERPSDWPEKADEDSEAATNYDGALPSEDGVLRLSLFEALEVAAANSREYQSQKEDLFKTALALDLKRNDFRNIFRSSADARESTSLANGSPDHSLDSSHALDWSKLLKNGASISAGLALDLVTLLTGDREKTLGIVGDVSFSMPLLRGAGRRIIAEELTRAERNVVYAIYSFERYRRTFAVRVAGSYLDVLQSLDSIRNAEENYRSLIDSARRTRSLADEGRISEIEVDQARQNELTARQRWIQARENYQQGLDSFKVILGLPVDAAIELDSSELDRLASAAKEAIGDMALASPSSKEDAGKASEIVLEEPSSQGAGPYEIDESLAIRLALENRLDLRTTLARVYDAQRDVIIAADALKIELDFGLGGSFGQSRSAGSASSPNAELRPERGSYYASLAAELPWDKTSERNSYRNSLISLEQAVRSLEEAEDTVKLNIRSGLRTLRTARESINIQTNAVDIAKKRVNSVNLFLDLGRAETRDLLDAQESLISAQNSLTAGLVDYRVAVLALQRDMGLLETDEKGLWREYDPDNFKIEDESAE